MVYFRCGVSIHGLLSEPSTWIDQANDLRAIPQVAAMRQLPVNPNVRLHSVIGHGYPMLSAGDSDGVVPVSSARHPGVQTETLVRAWHTSLHDHSETLRALLFILELHHAEYLASL